MFVIGTLEFSRDLERAGMQKKVADTLAEKIKEVQTNSSTEIATKDNIATAIVMLKQEIKISMLTTIIGLGAIMTLIEKFVN